METGKKLQLYIGRNINIVSDLFAHPVKAKLLGFDNQHIDVILAVENVWSPYSWAVVRHIFSEGYDEHLYAASPRAREIAEMKQYS